MSDWGYYQSWPQWLVSIHIKGLLPNKTQSLLHPPQYKERKVDDPRQQQVQILHIPLKLNITRRAPTKDAPSNRTILSWTNKQQANIINREDKQEVDE